MGEIRQTTTNTPRVGAVREPPLPTKHGLKHPSTTTKSQKSLSNPKNPNSDRRLDNYYICSNINNRSTDRHSAAQTCADPCPKRPQGSNVSRRRQRSTRRTRSKAAPTSRQRLCLLRRRPSSDRMSGARPGGPVPGARRVSPASQSEPAGHPPSTSEASARGMLQPRAGRPHVEPTDVYSCPPQEGGYSPRGASYR